MKKTHYLITLVTLLFFVTILSHATSTTNIYRSTADYQYIVAADLDGDGRDEIIGDFGSSGLWAYNATTLTWKRLNKGNARTMIVGNFDGDASEELVVDFPGVGIWIYDAGPPSVWFKIHKQDAKYMATFEYDTTAGEEILFDFGNIGIGLWVYEPIGNMWTRLNKGNPQFVLAEFLYDFDGDEEIIVDFGAIGVWFWNNGHWKRINKGNALNYMCITDSDPFADYEVLMDFGPFTGLWEYDDIDSPHWTKLKNGSPLAAATNFKHVFQPIDIGSVSWDYEVIVNWKGIGLWLYNNNFGAEGDSASFTKIHTKNPIYLSSAYVDDGDEELILCIGNGTGTWLWSHDNGSKFPMGYTKLNNNDSIAALHASIFPTGDEEVIFDFGSTGLYLYYYNEVSSSWVWRKINNGSPNLKN